MGGATVSRCVGDHPPVVPGPRERVMAAFRLVHSGNMATARHRFRPPRALELGGIVPRKDWRCQGHAVDVPSTEKYDRFYIYSSVTSSSRGVPARTVR